MSDLIRDLQVRRLALWDEGKVLWDNAEAMDRDLTAEEVRTMESKKAEIDELGVEIRKLQATPLDGLAAAG